MADVERLGVVPSGWTERAVLNAVPGLYPRVEFTYSPFTVLELAEYGQQAEPHPGPARLRLMAAHLARKVRSWDLKGADGKAWPLTPEGLLALRDPLFYRVWGVATCQQSADGEPQKSEAEKAEDFADQLRSAETGRPLADVREERLRGNLPGPSA